MRMRRLAVALFALLLTLPQPVSAARAPIAAFRGPGAWVDIFDDEAWDAPETTVAGLRAQGVQTLYLQTTSYRFKGPIRYPSQTSRFLDAAHANEMRVVGWYVPDYVHMKRDLRWSLDAIRFTSATGQRFDAFALDIEVTEVRDHAQRGRRAVQLSRNIRAAVGPGYPFGAIIPSILVPTRTGGEIAAGYWSNFPYAGLAAVHDCILPMAYWTYRTRGEAQTYRFIARGLDLIRRRGGRPNIPIHVIGGIANKEHVGDLRGFARAVRRGRVVGASFYDATTSGPEEWDVLRDLRPHLGAKPLSVAAPPKPTVLAIPAPPGQWRLDPTATRLRGGDRITFTFPAGGAASTIIVRGFDIGSGEVTVRLNGRTIGRLTATDASVWGARQRVLLFDPQRANRITFDNVANPPAANAWGVRVLGTAAVGPH